MTSFREISVDDYKRLLENEQHTFAKTFKNSELLRNFEKPKNKNTIDNIIKDEANLEKENKYIEKLSEKVSNKLKLKSNELIKDDDGEKGYNFLNNVDYYLPKTKKFGCVGRGDFPFQKLRSRYKSGETCLVTWEIRRVLLVDRQTCKNYALALVLLTFKNIVNLFMRRSNRLSRYQINVV